ncbi:DUF4835 family protein [Pedobacter faecalis]|uniref:type IX secretion system protein PorD n=1 Tax=Pedobacter faecalis TaxID=3041495 RepID=UPI0025505A67|nr:DUF4835 family protein [Pedobacter sp. ELA7]
MKLYASALFLFLVFCINLSQAQELNARVQVLAPQVSNIEKRNLDIIQNVVANFMNNNKWSDETYLAQERIECDFVITLTEWDGSSGYKAEAQIQSSRPVYGSSYNSVLLNLSDKDFSFNYAEGQPLDLSNETFTSNLSSLLSFYAYVIVGLDKDSFSRLGGTPYYGRAVKILNLAQTAGYPGWKAGDGLRNRFWLSDNLTNQNFEALRSFIYDYHFGGLDQLHENPARGVKRIIGMLPDLKQMDKQRLGSPFPSFYFTSKADELVKVCSIPTGDPSDRIKAYNILVDVDPANISKYDLLKANNDQAGNQRLN